jgi:hypothetical protein
VINMLLSSYNSPRYMRGLGAKHGTLLQVRPHK